MSILFKTLACLTLIGVAVLLMPGRAQAAPSETYQFPCYPYNNADYSFGQYVSGWGYHLGEDVCHNEGTPLYAVANGRVVYSARTPDSYRWGNLIMIEHTDPGGNKVVTLYGHMGDGRAVSAGQEVSKGQYIGYVGWRGGENGNWSPHLHFGVHPGGYGAPIGTYASWVHGYSSRCCDGWVQPFGFINMRLQAYDSQPLYATGAGLMWYNSSNRISIYVRNVGAQTWQPDDQSSTPVRLGTLNPRDHHSSFAGTSEQGWAGDGSRLQLEETTRTGEVGVFTATFNSNRLPGTYIACFSPLVETVLWMPERPACVRIDVQPPGWRAEYVGQYITTQFGGNDLSGRTDKNMYLLPGEKINAKVLLKNAGEFGWDKNSPDLVRLGTARPLNRSSPFATLNDNSIPAGENWISASRPSGLEGRWDPVTETIIPDDHLDTGDIGAFSFTVTAPSTPGTYYEYLQPLIESKVWMPDLAMWFPFRVLDQGYHHQYVNQSQTPTNVGSTTATQNAVLQIRNTGQQSWPVAGNFRIGTSRPLNNVSPFYTAAGDGAWISNIRPSAIDSNITSPGKTTVDPGEIAEFQMKLTIPPATPAGTYNLYVRPLLENQIWLPEDYGIYFPVRVTAPPHESQFIKETFSAGNGTVARGSPLTARLAVKNTGRMAWPTTGPNAVKLGTSRPNDRSSKFAILSGTDAWPNASRASLIEGRVTNTNTLAYIPATQINPGETALFSFPINTDLPAGTYNEYFNLVHEGIVWFPDDGIYFPVTITSGAAAPTSDQSTSPSTSQDSSQPQEPSTSPPTSRSGPTGVNALDRLLRNPEVQVLQNISRLWLSIAGRVVAQGLAG